MDDQLKQSVLGFHEFPVPGKIQVSPTKPLVTQRDLALTYSPGVVTPCLETEKDPLKAYKYTTCGSLVAVISNGTAMLGLGSTGALTGRPVIEGKGVLFKKFAGIDAFDIKIDELDPGKFIEVVAALEPTFGGINLEDIKAPECFYIEQKLHGRMNIPAFHDDQHDTAIISATAIPNGLRVVEKNVSDVRMVVSGAGTAIIAYISLLIALGLQKHNIVVCNSKGVIYQGHEPNVAETRAAYAVMNDGKRTLDDVTESADISLGYSGPKVLAREVVKKMARMPMILALADLEPEILPPLTKEVRPNAIVCTDRSDYPNQTNNVLCFPFVFRGTLGIGTTAINEEIRLATVHTIAELAYTEQSEVMTSACDDQDLSFDPEYITPKSFDPHLIVKIAPAVTKAAMESGVTTRPIADFDIYIDKLTEFVYKTNLFIKPIFPQIRKAPKHVVLPEGEEARILHATQELVILGLAKPTLIDRLNMIEMRIQKLGLQIKSGVDSGIVNNEFGPRFKEYWTEYFQIMKRHGVTQEQAQRALIGNPTVIGAIMVQRDETDAMICDTVDGYHRRFGVVKDVFSYHNGAHTAGAMSALLLPSGNAFIADTYISGEPDAEELAEVALMVAETVRRFGIGPRVALLSHSNFGSSDCPSSSKMRQALELVREHVPELMIDDEMHGGAALVGTTRNDRMPGNPLRGSANILVMPNMEAARISYNLLRVSSSEDVAVGPVLMGVAKSAHVLAPIASVHRIVNMAALAVVEAQTQSL